MHRTSGCRRRRHERARPPGTALVNPARRSLRAQISPLSRRCSGPQRLGRTKESKGLPWEKSAARNRSLNIDVRCNLDWQKRKGRSIGSGSELVGDSDQVLRNPHAQCGREGNGDDTAMSSAASSVRFFARAHQPFRGVIVAPHAAPDEHKNRLAVAIRPMAEAEIPAMRLGPPAADRASAPAAFRRLRAEGRSSCW